MPQPNHIDGALVQWGDRLFYPDNRLVRGKALPNLQGLSMTARAAAIRARIHAAVLQRSPQVMVKLTGGGRGMTAITAHFRYISKNGRLELENELGERMAGRDVVRDLAEDWRFGGSLIGKVGERREAFNIMLSMPRGADSGSVLRAAREFAIQELKDHKWVMVLHDHQANPHVHISARAESKHGRRMNPRKADLHRWRETFAEKLRDLGIDAEATRQATRGRSERSDPLWRIKAREDGRLRSIGSMPDARQRVEKRSAPAHTLEAWSRLETLLAASADPDDQTLARSIAGLLRGEAVDRIRGERKIPNDVSLTRSAGASVRR